MDAMESRDAYDIFAERRRAGSTIVTSNRGPDECLATFSDPVRAQSAIDRFTSNSYDIVMDGESYRPGSSPRCPLENNRRHRPSFPSSRERETGEEWFEKTVGNRCENRQRAPDAPAGD